MNETDTSLQLYAVFFCASSGDEKEKRALLTRGDVHGSRQAPPRRIDGNVSPTEGLRDEARLRAALLSYGALVCEIIAWLFSPALSFGRVVLL